MPKKNISQQKDGSWPITREDLARGVELGRLLHKTILDWAKSQDEGVHVRIIATAQQYIAELLDQKTTAVSSDVLLTQRLIEENGLAECIVEPFIDRLKEETDEEKLERARQLREMADKLDASTAPVAPVLNDEIKSKETLESVAGVE